MNINDTTDTGVIQNGSVVVNVTDENGIPVTVTNKPNNLSASFFLKLSSVYSIAAVDGAGLIDSYVNDAPVQQDSRHFPARMVFDRSSPTQPSASACQIRTTGGMV